MARIAAPNSSRQDYEPVRKEPAMKLSSMKPDGAQKKEKTTQYSMSAWSTKLLRIKWLEMM